MKVDYEKYPQIPRGCQLNENKRNGTFQVFKEVKVASASQSGGRTKYRRISVGVIKNGVFTMNRAYELEQELQKLQEQNGLLRSQLRGSESNLKNQSAERAEQKVFRSNDPVTKDSRPNDRGVPKSSTKISHLALLSLMSALGGQTQCNLMENYCHAHRQFFEENFPLILHEAPGEETFKTLLMLLEPKKFQDFFLGLIGGLISSFKNERKVSCSGGQIAISTDMENSGLVRDYALMNIYDHDKRVSLCQILIEDKHSSNGVGLEMIKPFNVNGAVITVDVKSCQVGFAEAVLSCGADYLLSLKDRQEASLKEVQNLFANSSKDNLLSQSGEAEPTYRNLENSRIEVISGKFLSNILKDKWHGLAEGSIVRILKHLTKKDTGNSSDEYSYFISSIPARLKSIKGVGDVVRTLGSIEEESHKKLEMYWSQDRLQAKNPNYLANLSQLNKLAFTLLENYRYRLWERLDRGNLPSFKTVQFLCREPQNAIECIAMGLGLG